MSIMHHIDKKQLLFLIIIGGLFYAGTVYRQNNSSAKTANADKMLDEKLLADLQSAEILVNDSVQCIMDCAEINTAELKTIFTSSNLDYAHCDFNNCHNISYALQGKTPSGKQVNFILESGESGNAITRLQVDGKTHCACS